MRDERIFFIQACLLLFRISVTHGVNTYLGCYADLVNNVKDLTGTALSFSNPTVEMCTTQCQPGGYPYAGLQMGHNCYCGMTYGLQGYSTDCNSTCSQAYCGGYHSNDIYYTVDNSLDSTRVYWYHSSASDFLEARKTCVQNNGDLPVVDQNLPASNVVKQVASSNSIEHIWIGLRKRLTGQWFEWTNENTVAFDNHEADFKNFWAPGENQSYDCVMMDVAAPYHWRTVPCDKSLPFVCFQIKQITAETNDSTTAQSYVADNPQAASNLLALYIVLPLFFLCYGGSCILFCVYKIYKNCWKKKASSSLLSQMEATDTSNPPFTPIPAPIYVSNKPTIKSDGRGTKPETLVGLPPSYYSGQEEGGLGLLLGMEYGKEKINADLPGEEKPEEKEKVVSKLDLPISDILRMKLMKQEAMKRQKAQGGDG